MDNWNQVPDEGSRIGYENGNGIENEAASGDGRRNYEKYMAGEVWSPNNNQQNMDNGYENQSQYGDRNSFDSQSGYNSFTPVNQTNNFAGLEEPVSVGEWIIAMLLMMIPCVNIILMFVWAFGNSEKKSKSNYFKATLIFAGVMFVLYLLLFIIFGVAGMSIMSGGF